MKAKNLLKILFLTVFAVYLTGCSGKPVTFNSVDPKLYANNKGEGRTISAEASGFQLLLFIPIGVNDRTERAYADAIRSVPGATGLINVTYSEDWFWWVIGTNRIVTVTGDAIREIK